MSRANNMMSVEGAVMTPSHGDSTDKLAEALIVLLRQNAMLRKKVEELELRLSKLEGRIRRSRKNEIIPPPVLRI